MVGIKITVLVWAWLSKCEDVSPRAPLLKLLKTLASMSKNLRSHKVF